ncbi:hypothetical protein EW146_g9971 [Bondarzewia mesenterica]|uniref:UCH catalytic domain-containing protein n=1 Tax=Bondarzewia mesenterica TaxID=1095465 RepID=A0A4S4L3G8_9AGAM|nr:hypothetical protein EW146_g9971 [Bondarzewia mesenterica]
MNPPNYLEKNPTRIRSILAENVAFYGDVDLHFTCFVQAPSASARENETEPMEMRLIELDGRRNGPIDRGVCTDFLRDVAKYVKEQMIPKASSAQFSMMALATGF